MTAQRDAMMHSRMADLMAGQMPTMAMLAASPLITRYSFIVENDGDGQLHVFLQGHVTGHERLPDGPATTSRLLWLDRDMRWCLTAGRYYQLGYRPEDLHVD